METCLYDSQAQNVSHDNNSLKSGKVGAVGYGSASNQSVEQNSVTQNREEWYEIDENGVIKEGYTEVMMIEPRKRSFLCCFKQKCRKNEPSIFDTQLICDFSEDDNCL